ncbi:glutamine amidotransferase [Poriferisphaera sp. WC338]|uniref:glutamine amidotransferase n=1 Tax=Poriferisphaera sp. WC338 TaxID=3425129 RepID=UPI003D813ACE
MPKDILYLGDTAYDQQAAYLAGIMTHFGITFDYVASDISPTDEQIAADYKAIILSDYPSKLLSETQLEIIVEKTNMGRGLLMIGGWETYVGLDGGYENTPLAKILPVSMQDVDDRNNNYWPCFVDKQIDHPIAANLPFDTHATTVGGFNAFAPKSEAITLLNISMHHASKSPNGTFAITPTQSIPLLVINQNEAANVACFASDVAPHWVGPLVDWGDQRLSAQAPGSNPVEIGNWYAQFFANLVKWTAKML